MSLPAPSQSHRIVAGLPFVEALARRMAASMPNSIDIGDLVQDGVIGLIDAAHRFDEARGIKFETFAERRVRGAMIDALRKDAWPRGVRRQRRELEAAREALRRELGHEPSMADLAAQRRLRREAPEPHHRPHQHHRIDLAARHRRARRRERRCRRRCVPSEPERPITPTRSSKTRDRVRAAIAVAAVARAQGDRPLLLRRSDDEADRRRDRRQRIARLAAARARDSPPARRARRPTMAPAQARVDARCAVRRSSQFLQKPAMAEGAPQADTPARRREPRSGGVVVALREHVAHGAQQVAEPERLGQPAAAALLEEALGVGAGDVAGDEDHALRQRRRRRRRCAR